MENTVVIYTHPECSFSSAAREDLWVRNISFREVDLSITPEAWGEVELLTGGDRITPVIVEGELVTVGFNGEG